METVVGAPIIGHAVHRGLRQLRPRRQGGMIVGGTMARGGRIGTTTWLLQRWLIQLQRELQ